MKNRLFKLGGGAGVGSFIIVLDNNTITNPEALKIRQSYDCGESLYLSIIDEVTEEALLPLTGYVDEQDILHLSGRDFDDNKTYEFTVNNAEQTISVEEKEGVTIGDTTIPTSGGGSEVPTFEATAFDARPISKEFILELSEEDIDDLTNNCYPVINIAYQGMTFTFTLGTGSKGMAAMYTAIFDTMSQVMILTFGTSSAHTLQTALNIVDNGTRLYRHTLTVPILDPNDNEPFDCSVVLTTLSQTSLKHTSLKNCFNSNYISGLIAPYREYPDTYYLMMGASQGTDPCIAFFPGEYSGVVYAFLGAAISADVVTPL